MRPATADELAAALHEADEHVQAVTPVGGGTQLDLGMPPARVDVLLETTALDRVVEYEPADLTVTVEAGMRFDALQRLLGENGQFLALDPPALEGATIGGLIATNASGPLRFSYGGPRDLVIGTRVANPDGTLTRAGGRVVKNVAGYDLNKLYIGSLGTLAIIVELSFKLAPIPPATATVAGHFDKVGAVDALVAAVVRSALAPLAIELQGSREVVFRLGGYPQAVERQVRDLGAWIEQHGGQLVERDWDQLMRDRLAARRREVVLKAAAPISASTALAQLLERQLADLEPTVWAHAGNGVAFAACSAPPDAGVLAAVRAEVSALGANASLVIERCPTALKRSIDVWGEPGPAIGLMRAIKAKLDPNNT
ncbi:MAG: FAD-binding oxidoreductase, partial [Chloroflexi bacterium]|nr:FAD-binding oxidoreductase [Chloroflexota bacterium]